MLQHRTDAEAIEALSLAAMPITTGKINTPQEVLAVCVLLDYGAGKMFPVPLPVNAAPMSKTELASHMTGQRLGSIPWLQLLNLLIPLLQQWLANNP